MIAPRISCILPVYNGEKYLAEAIRSIFDQSFGDFELIVIDDGSNDSTPAILEELKREDSRLRVLSQPNGGIVSALNNGLAAARGEYVARMDADDIALPNRFAFQIDYLDSNPGCAIVGGLAMEFLDDGTELGLVSGGRHKRTDLGVFPPKIAVATHPLIMARRSVLAAMGGYRGNFAHAEDYDLFIRAAAYGTIDNPPVKLLMYRRHEGAVSVKHLDVQERNAAEAELDAMTAAAHVQARGIEPWLLDPYVRFRIWRRCTVMGIERARTLLPLVIGDILSLRPRHVFSARYLQLRLRMAASVAKNLTSRALRNAHSA
jgi:glycosyltransferase involved in cell wall biosynthesis